MNMVLKDDSKYYYQFEYKMQPFLTASYKLFMPTAMLLPL